MSDDPRRNRFDVLLANITKRTNGNIIFREQMEAALISLGGFSIRHVPTIMKAILKKKRSALMTYYPLFRANLLGSYPDKDIDQLWESIVLSPALVEAGSLCRHLFHVAEGVAHDESCGVCFGIKNKFPVHPTVVMADEGFVPGSLEDKTRNLNIDVVLGLLERYKKEEKVLADSNVIVIDNIEEIPPDKLMDALNNLPSDIGGMTAHFDQLRAKGEPISAAGKAALERTYLDPAKLKEVLNGKFTITERPKTGDGRVMVFKNTVGKAGDILKKEPCCKLGEMEMGRTATYIPPKPLGCTCRDGKDHDLCPVCHEHAMRGMNRTADMIADAVDGKPVQNVADQITDKDRWLLDNIDTKDDAEWMKRYEDSMGKGTPIDDYDRHYPPNGERLMRMRTDIKKPNIAADLVEDEPLLGVPAANNLMGHLTTAPVQEVGGEPDDLAQKEIVEPEVCKCNIWAGCTCGVMERERARKKDEELKW